MVEMDKHTQGAYWPHERFYKSLPDNEVWSITAKVLGWTDICVDPLSSEYKLLGIPPMGDIRRKSTNYIGVKTYIPNYIRDLNAVVEVENDVLRSGLIEPYVSCLLRDIVPDWEFRPIYDPRAMFDMMRSTPLQRCRAFLCLRARMRDE